MKQKSLRLGFDVTMDKGATWKPLKIQLWTQESQFTKVKPSEPLKYMADALTGLSLLKLQDYAKNPAPSFSKDESFTAEAWQYLEPHRELYDRTQQRVRALQSHLPVVNPAWCTEFESIFSERMEVAVKPWGLDLTALWPLLDVFAEFENKIGSALLYNFGLNFSPHFLEKLQTLHSFLYHLRNIVAVDHNAHIDDPSHEGVRVDAITDYLPRAEYVVNDALMYWNFKKLAQPFTGAKNGDARIEKLLLAPMEKTFHKYSHHACHLVDHLPKNFIGSLNPMELEEAFYLVQMDWVLGTPAGLLFKIREEIFALQSGYEKIFWKDAEPPYHGKPVQLQVSCQLNEANVFGKKVA
ncbi:MAG: hypothetical protein AAGB31_04750 [Bdellovibrio sp.]